MGGRVLYAPPLPTPHQSGHSVQGWAYVGTLAVSRTHSGSGLTPGAVVLRSGQTHNDSCPPTRNHRVTTLTPGDPSAAHISRVVPLPVSQSWGHRASPSQPGRLRSGMGTPAALSFHGFDSSFSALTWGGRSLFIHSSTERHPNCLGP